MTAPLGEADNSDDVGQYWQRFLARRVEQALRRQLLFQLLESELQGSHACRLQELHIELVFPARFVHAQAPASNHRQSVLRLEFQVARLVAEAHSAKLRGFILEREVQMTGTGDP